MRNLFTTVKAVVTTRQAAEYYGLKVSRNGMTCCPFHDDRHPSMKVDERFYCFGCHETGDVIDFTARIFGLTAYEAAQKLACDFHIDPNTPAPAAASPLRRQQARQRDVEAHCIRVLVDYEYLLKRQKEQFAPSITDESWDERFMNACDALPLVGYHLDCLYSPDPELRKETAEDLTRDGTIQRMEDELRLEKNEVRQRRTSDSDCLQSPSEASERRSRLMAGKEVSGHGTDPARAA